MLPTDKCNTDETQELKCLLCLAAESSPCPGVILGRKRKTNKIISEKSLGLRGAGNLTKVQSCLCLEAQGWGEGAAWPLPSGGGSPVVGRTTRELHLHTLLLPFSQNPLQEEK